MTICGECHARMRRSAERNRKARKSVDVRNTWRPQQIVNFICDQIVAHFFIAKTGHLRCCLYISKRIESRALYTSVEEKTVANRCLR